VTFTVTAGGGLLNGLLTPVTVISNASGLAEVSFRLGGVAPGINTVSVTGASLPLGSITFTEVGT
jgi:hypothetical protein